MPDPDPASELVDAFWAVARQVRHASAAALTTWDLTPSQARALITLARHGEMRPGELARHLRITPRSATEVVDGLAGPGLVERVADPGDRRAVRLRLTERGAGIAGAIREARADGARQVFDRLPDRDRAELARILGVLRHPPEPAAPHAPQGPDGTDGTDRREAPGGTPETGHAR
ncbi:MarR family transcriptional regulator [Pseudonocardia sp. NPDC046786]|uniref:MarR family winged helix-turn-helix transcriptional regulator n=1 Tax=Pseudonocardia sp. NPDC046786 TaxID=3155471 RepID=UPI0033DD30F1